MGSQPEMTVRPISPGRCLLPLLRSVIFRFHLGYTVFLNINEVRPVLGHSSTGVYRVLLFEQNLIRLIVDSTK